MATHSSALSWDEGAWWAAIYGVAQSRTRLKRLSIVSLISFSFISAQIFMISFLILILGFFVLLFPVVLGINFGCPFNVFLAS